jgi:hypothetical protein
VLLEKNLNVFLPCQNLGLDLLRPSVHDRASARVQVTGEDKAARELRSNNDGPCAAEQVDHKVTWVGVSQKQVPVGRHGLLLSTERHQRRVVVFSRLDLDSGDRLVQLDLREYSKQ